MAGTITHYWDGTTLVVTSDSGTSSCDLKGAQGDMGVRGVQGAPGAAIALAELDKKLDKITTPSEAGKLKLYAVDEQGKQTTLSVPSGNNPTAYDFTFTENTDNASGTSYTASLDKAYDATGSIEIPKYTNVYTNLTSKAALITSIEEDAFLNSELSSVTIPKGVISIGARAFCSCNKLQNVNIAYGTTSIGEDAFYFCENLLNVKIPQSVTSIGEGAFSICRNLTTITIPHRVTSIEYSLFDDCINLQNVILGRGITEIKNLSFERCVSLNSLTIYATNPPTVYTNFSNDTSSLAVIYVPAESVDAYKSADGWSAFADIIQAIQ